MDTQNSGKNKGHANLRPFKPGQSGNPAGRPAVAKDVRENLRRWITEEGGYERLIELAMGNTREAKSAVELIFAYALGRPTQPLAGADRDDEHDALEIVINTRSDPPPPAS